MIRSLQCEEVVVVKRYFVYAFLIALLGLPSYGQQAKSTKCKGARAGCTMQRGADLRQRTVVADAGFGTFMVPSRGYPQRARFETASLTAKDTTPQAAAPVAPTVREESLGEIARRFRAEKKTHHVPAYDE